MLVAIRSPSGTTRIEIPNDSVVKDIFVKLREKGINIDGSFITTSPSGQPLQQGSSLTSLGLKSGDLLYLKGGASAFDSSPSSPMNIDKNNNNNNNNNNKSSIKTATESTGTESTESSLTSQCKHSPLDKCVFCSDAVGEKKCDHAENTTCVNCQNKKFKGKRLKWLCNHGPNQKCSNCLKVPKIVEYKCNHGPYSKCINCLGKAEKEKAKAQEESNDNNNNNNENGFKKETKEVEEFKPKCTHGSNAKCTNCLPKDDPNSIEPVKRRCKNHGPHGSCIDCIEWRESSKMKVKSQDKPECPGIKVDFNAANVFQQYVNSKKKEKVQRIGYVYGSYQPDKSVLVDVIYEPPQRMSQDGTIELLPNPYELRVDAAAQLLGLTRVGWIFSHPSRKYVMSSQEIIKAAEFQNQYGSSFTTLILSINSEGKSNLEAFQVSDQALKLEKLNEFSSSQQDPMKLKLKNPVFEEGVETKTPDTNFFIVTVPVKARDDPSPFGSQYPVENRDPPPTDNDFTSYRLENQDQSPLVLFSDFHFLIYLLEHEIFDFDTEFPTICEGISAGSNDTLSLFVDLIEFKIQEIYRKSATGK